MIDGNGIKRKLCKFLGRIVAPIQLTEELLVGLVLPTPSEGGVGPVIMPTPYEGMAGPVPNVSEDCKQFSLSWSGLGGPFAEN